MMIDFFKRDLLTTMTYECYKMDTDSNGNCATNFSEPASDFGPAGLGFFVDEYKPHFELPFMHGVPYFIGCFFGLYWYDFSKKEDSSLPSRKFQKWKSILGWAYFTIAILVSACCFPAMKLTAIPWVFLRHYLWSFALGWFCLVVVFRGKDGEEKLLDDDDKNTTTYEDFYKVNDEADSYQNKNHHFLGYLLHFLFRGAAQSWSRILNWAILISPLIVNSYYNIYLEDPIYIQSTTLIILWFGFCSMTFVVSYFLRLTVV